MCGPITTPTHGTLGLCDPFILRKQDGTFEVIASPAVDRQDATFHVGF